MRIGVKYCGGCDPGYDRVGMTGQLREALAGKAEFVASDAQGVSLVVVLAGCPGACADTSSFAGLETLWITCPEDAEDFLKRMGMGGEGA